MTAIRDPQQAMEALALANDVRLHVARFKRDLARLPQHEGVTRVIETIDTKHNDPLLGAARVRHLLLGIDHIGAGKARKLMTVAQIYNHDKRLRDLTARQRNLLVALLEVRGWRS